MKKIILIIISLCFNCGLWAENMALFDVNPLRGEYTVKPGEKLKGFFTLRSKTGRTIKLDIEAADWFVLDDNKGIDASNWLKFKSKTVKLKAGEIKDVPYIIDMPKNAVGELAGKVSFIPSGGAGSMVNVVMSVSIYAFVDGTDIVDAVITQNKFRKEENGYTAIVVLKNNGNVHFRPKCFVTFTGAGNFNKVVELDYGWPVFPKQERGYFGKMEGLALEAGSYNAQVEVDLEKGGRKLESQFAFNIDAKGDVFIR